MRLSLSSLWVVVGCALTTTPVRAADKPQAAVHRKYESLSKDYCLSCHNEEKHKGSVRLDNLSFEINSMEAAERWQKVLNALNSGEIP